MPKRGGAMHVATTRRHYKGKVYQTHLLRRSYRQDGKVKHETLANLSHLPAEAIELVRRTLKGETFVAAADAFQVTRSLPHGHVALVWQAARQLGLPGLLGPRGRLRDLAMALVVARVVKPGSKLATTRWWADTTLAAELGVVGDRGMITSARVEALRELGGVGWITCLRAAQIRQLATDGPLQLSLFDQTSLAEITHPDFPGERLVCCRNPALATERARKRVELLAATEAELDKVARLVAAGRLKGAAKVGVRIGKVLAKFKVAKHFDLQISDTTFTYARRGDQIAAEAALDGIYVVRTSVAADRLDPPGVVEAYKQLAGVERDFRSLKTIDLELRPIWHRLDGRVRAHVLMCMLACYLAWHLRRALAPLTFTDEQPRERPDPVAPAQRSADAAAKASRRRLADDTPAHSFRTLLDHLGTLVRDEVEFTDPTGATIHKLTSPTPTQRQAFELVGAPIPLALT